MAVERPTVEGVDEARCGTDQRIRRLMPARTLEHPGETVAIFAVQYTYTDDAERVATFRPEHREYLNELHQEGVLLLSGPLGGGPGGLLIMKADSEESALATLDRDPFKREAVIVDRVAREWTVVIGEVPGA